jgi:hypothetical protein
MVNTTIEASLPGVYKIPFLLGAHFPTCSAFLYYRALVRKPEGVWERIRLKLLSILDLQAKLDWIGLS